jgi:hypothetical protein
MAIVVVMDHAQQVDPGARIDDGCAERQRSTAPLINGMPAGSIHRPPSHVPERLPFRRYLADGGTRTDRRTAQASEADRPRRRNGPRRVEANPGDGPPAAGFSPGSCALVDDRRSVRINSIRSPVRNDRSEKAPPPARY